MQVIYRLMCYACAAHTYPKLWLRAAEVRLGGGHCGREVHDGIPAATLEQRSRCSTTEQRNGRVHVARAYRHLIRYACSQGMPTHGHQGQQHLVCYDKTALQNAISNNCATEPLA
jgi:hypothetical protein